MNMQGPVTKIEPRIAAKLSKQKYQLVGEHGGVKVCHWTKQSLIADRSCYKGTFYGIESHGCMQGPKRGHVQSGMYLLLEGAPLRLTQQDR